MSEKSRRTGGRSGSPRRLVVFGVTGQLGQELLERLDESDWPISELAGIASTDSIGESFEFRGEDLNVLAESPPLKGWDLVFICTRGVSVLEIVRECLRAEVACIDMTGALSSRTEVPMPISLPAIGGKAGASSGVDDPIAAAPFISVPCATTLAWGAVLEAIGSAANVSRVVGTVLSSAAAHGRNGLVALSEESMALFNQSDPPPPGPAGQAVAFDVVPGGGIDCDRLTSELARVFGDGLRVGVASVQVPTFVGEGASLVVELASPLERAALEALLEAQVGLSLVAAGPGSRGLEVVGEEESGLAGPTLRDTTGVDEVLVGRIEPDPSLSAGHGWRLWIACDPLRVVSGQAIRIAARRLGLD